MLLGLIFIATNFAVGLIILNLLGLKFSKVERIAGSFLIGVLAGTWLVFILGLIFGSMGAGVYIGAVINLVFIGIFRKKIKIDKAGDWRFEGWILLALLVFFCLLNYGYILTPSIKGYKTGVSAWGDIAIHLSVINSFSKADNFPPMYPIYSGHKMGYPVLFDFYSAILNRLGMDLRASILIPNILMFSVLFFLFYALALRMSRDKRGAIIAVILLIFSGGLGFLNYIYENNIENDNGFNIFNNLRENGIDYTHNGEMGYRFLNFTASVLAQRGAILGYGTALFILIFIIPYLIGEERLSKKQVIFFGIILGLLPFIHAHAYLSLMFIIFILSIMFKKKEMVYFFIPAVLFMIPQLLWMRSQMGGGFISFHLGWVPESNSSIFGWIIFWIKNIGLALFLFTWNLKYCKTKKRIIYYALIGLFVLANLIKFQPWDYDNLKILYFTLFFILIGSGELLSRIYEKNHKGWIFAVIIILVMCLSGFLTLNYAILKAYPVYNDDDLRIAEEIDWVAEKDAIFLTASNHNHLLPMLTGRSVFRGYPGWLWTHGIVDDREEVVKAIYEGEIGKKEIREYGIDYIYIGPMEIDSDEFKVDIDFFEENFEKAYENGKISVYGVE